MLKKNTPKAKRKPAKASELFTFATEPGWEKKLDPDILELPRNSELTVKPVANFIRRGITRDPRTSKKHR